MKTVDVHQAKIHLSKLVDEAFEGKPFVIAKEGKPMVKVTALDAPVGEQVKRLGFMIGQISVRDNFDSMGQKEIEHMFTAKR
jgi:prevent-host-death family protein